MDEKGMKEIVDKYIRAYNDFDVEEMIKHIHDNVEFKNIAQGQVNLSIQGKENLKTQAEKAVNLFKKREMKIIQQKIEGNQLENKIEFTGVLAMDIPDGPTAGETIKIEGKSIFKFEDDKIILIEDIN